jgi:hypothetical protein
MPKKKAEEKPPRSPEEVVEELHPAYQEWKGGEKAKEKLKKEFFTGITEWIKENGEPEEDYLIVIGADEEAAIEAAEKERPGWIVEAVRPYLAEGDEEQVPDAWEVIVSENPEFMPFTIEFAGKVYGRQIVEGPSMLENERLEEEDPELWARVAKYPMQNLLESIAYEAGMDHRGEEFEQTREGVTYIGFDGYIAWQCERHGVKRQLISLDEMTDKDAGSLQAYMYLGPPSVKLPAPTKAKEGQEVG